MSLHGVILNFQCWLFGKCLTCEGGFTWREAVDETIYLHFPYSVRYQHVHCSNALRMEHLGTIMANAHYECSECQDASLPQGSPMDCFACHDVRVAKKRWNEFLRESGR